MFQDPLVRGVIIAFFIGGLGFIGYHFVKQIEHQYLRWGLMFLVCVTVLYFLYLDLQNVVGSG